MMEAERTSETLVNFYQTTWRYNPEDSHLRTHRRENLKSYVVHIIATMALDHINATITLDTTVAFHTIFAFVNPLVVLLTPSLLMWREDRLWNFSVLQKSNSFESCS
jgi:hypothetical protein